MIKQSTAAGQALVEGQVRSKFGSLPGTEAPALVELMRMSHEECDAWTQRSAIRRAGYAGFRRNVAVGLGNWLAGLDEPPGEAVALLRDACEGESELVREHAAWALGQNVSPGLPGRPEDWLETTRCLCR